MRVYSTMEQDDQVASLKLKELFDDYPFVDLCNVTRVLQVHNITRPLFPMTWRFLPLMDPTVDRLLPRDSDSLMTAREIDAVRDWLSNSNATFHFMRDHWMHCETQILGGNQFYIYTFISHHVIINLRVLGSKTLPESTSHFGSFSENFLRNGT